MLLLTYGIFVVRKPTSSLAATPAVPENFSTMLLNMAPPSHPSLSLLRDFDMKASLQYPASLNIDHRPPLKPDQGILMALTLSPAEIIEANIEEYSTESLDCSAARKNIRHALLQLADMPEDSSPSFSDIFERLATTSHLPSMEQFSTLTIRLVSCNGLLPETIESSSGRHLVKLIEQGNDTITKILPDRKKSLNHTRLAAYARLHSDACQKLQILTQPISGLHDLVGRRQTLMQTLNHGYLKSYLYPLGFQATITSIGSILNLVGQTTKSHDRELQTNLQNLSETVGEEIDHLESSPTFYVKRFILPFLCNVQTEIDSLRSSMAEKFDCDIVPPASVYEIPKKYPLHALHVADIPFELHIPLENTGPGVALNVRACCIAENCTVRTEETNLGEIEPAPFILTVRLSLDAPSDGLEVHVSIEWDVLGQTATRTCDFIIRVLAQRTDLDWMALSRQQPYSLEVAYDEHFYGRSDALQRLIRRVAPDSMQSCYITGQKRVGKSSLARAVEARITNAPHDGAYHVLYLECGEIRHATGPDTLQELGQQLESFLSALLPRHVEWAAQDYSSSLIPLNRLLISLNRELPETRVIVILDEFDEINEDLYRYGELANTFFLNLRTLSSRPNVAFILVGAEKMPYVMSSQGEKLNRFARESLDSFDLSSEWADYRALVENPVKHSIKVHKAAVRKLFELTDGHPYFTKVLCIALYEQAVQHKDAEISLPEVDKAAERMIASLDTNAFAHYWRDGIRGDSEKVEIVSLNRCRLLVAWARAARAGLPPTQENISRNLYSNPPPVGDVPPLLDDFCRRNVLRQVEDAYDPTVSLFAAWLREGGFSRLVSDQLGDELAAAKQSREDVAYVHAQEIRTLVENWDLYQGRQITSEDVRAWIQQVESNVERRILFKILQNVRFLREPEIREKFEQAHRRIRSKLPAFVKRSRAQRREDIFVTYGDGLGKSGAHYASIYAAVNEIASTNIVV
ncbi:MAG: ATP-binding protein, partial [Rhodobacteraceae bacterium]|nr:ATP-binding protein [Paracoccaceae bacterium]